MKKVYLNVPEKPDPKRLWRVRIIEKTVEFRNYVRSFYGPGGLYDMGASDTQIAQATIDYIRQCQYGDDHICWGNGDSVDRERVRDILIDRFGLKFPNAHAA